LLPAPPAGGPPAAAPRLCMNCIIRCCIAAASFEAIWAWLRFIRTIAAETSPITGVADLSSEELHEKPYSPSSDESDNVSLPRLFRPLVVPDDMSEVSELSLFLSWTMLKSANLEKSVLAPWPMSRADLRDSRSRTSSNFFLTSGPPLSSRTMT
jgi:hypothetical protein